MNKIAKFVVFHPKAIITLTLAATVGFASAIFARGISFNGSPEMLARDDSALQFFKQARETFGDDRVIIVALTTGEVFTGEFILKLDRVTKTLAALDGVDEAQSLTNVKAIRRDAGGVTVDNLIPRRILSGDSRADQLAALKEEVTRDPLYARQFVSTDARTAAINVFLKTLGEAETRAVAEEVERVAKSEARGDEVLLAGVPVMDARGILSMLRDMLVCSPVAALLCFVVFLLAFRSFWGAALPMAALVMGLIWTIGLMSLLGRPITLATLSLPTVLMAVGSSYIFHVLNQYRISMSALVADADPEGERAAWLDGLQFISPAVIVSGTTTMAGFAALASSSIPTVRDMGVFEAAGAAAMLALSLAFVPAALTLLHREALGRASAQQKDYAAWLNGPLRNITALILFRRRAVLIATLAVTLLVGAGAIWLRVNTDYLRIFPPGSETVQAAEKLHERLAGAATVQLVVGGPPGAITDPDFMGRVASLQEFALRQPGVDAAISIVDIIDRLNSFASPVSDGSRKTPQERARLESMFDNFLSDDESISRLVSRDRSQAIVILRTNLFSSNELRELTDRIQEWSTNNLPSGMSARATGSFILLNDASDAVAASQLSSLAIALVSIYLMMVIMFRSFATGLLALIPNLLPIICYFGFLGWTGITLDITTSLVASAVLGLAVDNAVHIIRRYRQCAGERARAAGGGYSKEEEGWAMWLTMLRTGKPMVLANLMLMAAFLIFVLSSFVPVRTAGLLWAVTIFACLAADLVFLPVLIKSYPFARTALPDDLKGAPSSEHQQGEFEKVIK
ncbi:MAG TPA: efflux RND transporter permease subunit [Blastocatellia bacterium]|jgi:predicted RND superfamily exporter protein|nr:efflux RND transporter permease subunit [Blastocatellia bacterium]